MCGRTRAAMAPEDVLQQAHTSSDRWKNASQYQPRQNCHPGNQTPVVYQAADGHPAVMTAAWGLVPSFHKPTDKLDHFKMFNARCETIDTKGIFKRLINRKRCVVFVQGFFEWIKDEQGQKQPYYVYRKDNKLLAMAGLWDCWAKWPHDTKKKSASKSSKSKEKESVSKSTKSEPTEEKSKYQQEIEKIGGESSEEVLYSYTILTTNVAPQLKWLHTRMPVILNDQKQIDAWIDTNNSFDDLLHHSDKCISTMFHPIDRTGIAWFPVSKQMNKMNYDAPDVAKPIDLEQEKSLQKEKAHKNSIKRFFQASPDSKNTKSPAKRSKIDGKHTVNSDLDQSSQEVAVKSEHISVDHANALKHENASNTTKSHPSPAPIELQSSDEE